LGSLPSPYSRNVNIMSLPWSLKLLKDEKNLCYSSCNVQKHDILKNHWSSFSFSCANVNYGMLDMHPITPLSSFSTTDYLLGLWWSCYSMLHPQYSLYFLLLPITSIFCGLQGVIFWERLVFYSSVKWSILFKDGWRCKHTHTPMEIENWLFVALLSTLKPQS